MHQRFGSNLAGIAVFGSYNNEPYLAGTSDIDIIVLLHRADARDMELEKQRLVWLSEMYA